MCYDTTKQKFKLMNIKTLILLVFLVAVGCFITHSLENNTEKNVKALQHQNDSLVRSLNELSELVNIPVEDSTLQQFCKIPDTVKVLWWEYKELAHSFENEYVRVDSEQTAQKNAAIKAAEQERDAKIKPSDKKYSTAERAAVQTFLKNSKDYMAYISNAENANYVSPSLNSVDSSWHMYVSYYYDSWDNNYVHKEMPADFKEMIDLCKHADSIRNSIKQAVTQVFESKKEAAEKTYSDRMQNMSKWLTEFKQKAYGVYKYKLSLLKL